PNTFRQRLRAALESFAARLPPRSPLPVARLVPHLIRERTRSSHPYEETLSPGRRVSSPAPSRGVQAHNVPELLQEQNSQLKGLRRRSTLLWDQTVTRSPATSQLFDGRPGLGRSAGRRKSHSRWHATLPPFAPRAVLPRPQRYCCR